jgi:hypothetical protein
MVLDRLTADNFPDRLMTRGYYGQNMAAMTKKGHFLPFSR